MCWVHNTTTHTWPNSLLVTVEEQPVAHQLNTLMGGLVTSLWQSEQKQENMTWVQYRYSPPDNHSLHQMVYKARERERHRHQKWSKIFSKNYYCFSVGKARSEICCRCHWLKNSLHSWYNKKEFSLCVQISKPQGQVKICPATGSPTRQCKSFWPPSYH